MVHLGGGAACVAALPGITLSLAGAMCNDIATIATTARGNPYGVDWVYVERLVDPTHSLADVYLQLEVLVACG